MIGISSLTLLTWLGSFTGASAAQGPAGAPGDGPITLEAHAAAAGVAVEDARGLWPLTTAESSGHRRSSTLAEVEGFLAKLDGLPASERISQSTFGETTEGRALHAVRVGGAAGSGGPLQKLCVLINANIHGGEIEGKVATQILLREFALGYHADLLEHLELTFVPVFNADGNDRIARTNRVTQNGPDEGVGERPNAMGLDLNRDFVKLETPEVRALTTLIRAWDPHVFMDLHTTNGSPHGYDLTYASSLSPNAPEKLADYMADRFFPAVRARLAADAVDPVHVFDYGNFGYKPRERGSRGEPGDPIHWSTYDSRPRFGTNLMGLRGKVSILSEAYSYLPYERRIEATYRFVLECLRKLALDHQVVLDVTRAERRDALGVDAALDSVGMAPVRVGRWDEVIVDLDPLEDGVQEGRRRVSAGPDVVREIEMDVRSRFRAQRQAPLTNFFAIVEPSLALLETLELHLGPASRGGALERIEQARMGVEISVFVVGDAKKSQRVFQGHREVSLEGRWVPRMVDLPPGTLIVRASTLAAHLLHPESDDSLTTWNFFDAHLFREADREADAEEDGGADAGKAPDAIEHPVVMIR